MTTIFIKLLYDPPDPSHPLFSRRRAGERPVMRNELQRSGSRAGVTEGANQLGTYISTVSLCNANFSRG